MMRRVLRLALPLFFVAALAHASTFIPGIVTTIPGATTVSDTPTVQAAQYVSGNCIGGFRSVSIAQANGGVIDPTAFMLQSVSGQTPSVTVYLFASNPSASTCTDKGTFTLNSADVTKQIGPAFSFTLSAPTGTSVTQAQQTFSPPRIANAGASSQLLYYALVSGSTFTPGGIADLIASISALH